MLAEVEDLPSNLFVFGDRNSGEGEELSSNLMRSSAQSSGQMLA
jgi:hypothetical protein